MMKTLILALALIATAHAEDCTVLGGKITATGNRGVHFDVNGGMKHGGFTVLYPTREQTTFGPGVESFKPGYFVTFNGVKTENGMCIPGKTTVAEGVK